MVSVLTNVISTALLIELVYSQDSAQIDHLENLIKIESQKAADYILPSDARQFEATNKTVQDYGSYDFIIIGGGTSGSVLASRLSEEKKFSVLVLEAGEFIKENSVMQIPKYYYLGISSDYNWAFTSVPQTTACLGLTNSQCSYPRGRAVGGTTAINNLLYDRGAPGLFDIMAKMVEDKSWSYKNILKYYKKSENFHWNNPKAPVDIKAHGKDGLLDVEQTITNVELNDIFLKAHKELGLPITDYNGPERIGGSILQWYTRNGRRLDMGTAFIKPFLNRTNLKVSTGSYVTKIVFNKTKVAEQVIFTKNGSYYSVRANKEIILSAGTFQSPQILMLSGIGPMEHLKKHNIDVIANLEVGSKYLDYTGTRGFLFSTNYPSPSSSLKDQILEYLNGTGPLTSSFNSQVVTFSNVFSSIQDVSDIEILSNFGSGSTQGWKNENYQALYNNINVSIEFSVRNTNPKSFGTVRLNSSDPFEYPVIDPRFLSDPKNEDIRLMYEGLQIVFNLAKTSALKQLNLTYDSQPLPACKQYEFKSKDYWFCFLRQVSHPRSHPVGSCSMGVSRCKGCVVDSKLKVFGVKHLRVVDASVFPISTGGHTSMPCVMIAEKTADIIKNKYGPFSGNGRIWLYQKCIKQNISNNLFY